MTLFSGFNLLGDPAQKPADHSDIEAQRAMLPEMAGARARPIPPGPEETTEQHYPVAVPQGYQQTARELATEIRCVLDERTRQWQSAEARAARVFNVLLNLALRLCREAYDDEIRRTGGGIARWTPERLGEFVLHHAHALQAQAVAATDPLLAAKHIALTEEHHQTLDERNRFDSLLQQQEQELHTLRMMVAEREQRETIGKLKGQVAGLEKAHTGAPIEAKPTPIEAKPTLVEATRSPVESKPPRGPVELPQGGTSTGPTPAPTNAARVDDLIRLMAATGLARLNKLRERLATIWGVEKRSGAVSNVINAASENGWVQIYDVKSNERGAPKSYLLVLTEAGIQRARELNAPPVDSEVARAFRLKLSLEMLSLILRAADVLAAEKHTSISILPEAVQLSSGAEYRPSLSAIAPGGERVFFECERESREGRKDRWQLAAEANGGVVRLIASSPMAQGELVNEINLARAAGATYKLLACNLVEYGQNKRGKDGSLWLYKN